MKPKTDTPSKENSADHSVLSKAKNTKNNTIKIQLIIPTGAYFLSGLRNLALNIAKEMTGLDDQWSFRWQTVVDELVNNAIEHGSAAEKEIKITFISKFQESIEVFIEDSGTGKNKKTAEEMNAYLNDHEKGDPAKIQTIRGRGLRQIASEWTDQLEFTDNEKGGLTVHALKKA